MGKKFDKIYRSVMEAVNSRYTVGGYLPGDLVKFRPDYKSSPTYKAMHSVMQKDIDDLIKSGLNIKVVNVGSRGISTSMSNSDKAASDIVVTIAGDQGGGRHYGGLTVTPDMIDVVSVNDPSPPIPDSFYRKDTTNYKPEEWQEEDGEQNITRVTDPGGPLGDGKKHRPTNLKLAGESTKFTTDKDNLGMLYENIYSEQ